MPFSDLETIEEALRERLDARALHEIWEQRQPVPESRVGKRAAQARATTQSAEWIQYSVGLACRFIQQAFQNEEYWLVCEAAREILGYWEQEGQGKSLELVRARTRFAIALMRLGHTQDAIRELERCLRVAPGTELKAEIYRQLGNVKREEAQRASDRATAVQAIEAGLKFYQKALELEPRSPEALVWIAAGTLYVAGAHSSRRAEALSYAGELLELADARKGNAAETFEIRLARAEALALLGKEEEAWSVYQSLRNVEGGGSITELAEARHRARFLADALGKPRDLFKGAFSKLHLIVFSGHMPDRPDQPGQPVRFPDKLSGQVRELLRAELEKLGAHIGISSAAAGADLLLLDELRQRPASRFYVVLPWSRDQFRGSSVIPYEPSHGPPIWQPLFDEALAAATTVRELGDFYDPPGNDSVAWSYMMEVTAGLAVQTARMLRLDVQPLVLWDERSGRGAGGTEDFVRFWEQRLGEKPSIVKMPRIETTAEMHGSQGSVRRAQQQVLRQEVKTMLFADIVGYSKLKEEVIPNFINFFLSRVSQLAATSPNAPQSINTWGDAVYAVFDFAVHAGNFALELAQMIHDNEADWEKHQLYWEEPASSDRPGQRHLLNIRIGLHTGPVFIHFDPVTRQLGYTGAHVSKAARIEPVTQPGEVYASEEFSAFAELGPQAATFVCEYVRSMELAKGYPGRHRIYRLVPGRRLDIEELARTIHECYCDEARGRGETPESNSALRVWDELSENMREANREQGADALNKLRGLGYELTHRGGLKPTAIVLDSDRVEQMAKDEHLRWMAERQRNGWTYAEKRDNARKQHPLLVDWDHLSEVERSKDRDVVRYLPSLIEKAGFRVKRISETT